ncbi:MAG: pentapeptide repeat-containing protein [Bacteroidetes bacterium]|nr:pentapeptide repeat-containing protein [Bacteroidota bacterium]
MKPLSSVLFSFVVIAVIAYTFTFTGCSNSVTSTGTGTAPQTYPALTERDFLDTNFYAVPGSVVMLYLEDRNSPADPLHPDTDSSGTDVVRVRLANTVEHTIKLGDSCRFTLTIKDKVTGNIVTSVDPVNNTQTVTLPAGDYIIKVRSLVEYTGGSDSHQNIFFQPDRNATFNRGGGNQQVDVDTNAVHTLLTTNSCVSCNLSYANLSYANLKKANLHYADLSYADLSYANLDTANLSLAELFSTKFGYANIRGANLTGVSLFNTIFSHANLSYANLTYVTLTNKQPETNFQYANLSYANLSYADLRNVYFYHANLSYANLSYANLSYATLSNANFCNAIKTGIIKTGVYTNSGTQCWP